MKAAVASPRQAGGRKVLTGILAVVTDARLFTRGVELFGLAVREFFFPQFETRLFPGVRPVVTISDPLDARIPYMPGRVRHYLGFIGIWVLGLGAMKDRFGREALPEIAASIRDLCRLYRSAGSVYRRCQTTTERPRGPLWSPHFLLIRLFDPHLHCVPSLHVLIVCYNYLNLRRVLGGRTAGSDASLTAEAYRAALQIVRVVLLVKQHSLADIGPSLFMLSQLFPQYDSREARRFATDLFRGFPGVTPGLGGVLSAAVLEDYRELQRRFRGRAGSPVEDFMVEYLRAWKPPARRPRRKLKPAESRSRRD